MIVGDAITQLRHKQIKVNEADFKTAHRILRQGKINIKNEKFCVLVFWVELISHYKDLALTHTFI
jgi:hypothetical protein